jgi:hypothetical protein
MPQETEQDLAGVRRALTEQVGYLLDEIEHLRSIVHRIPGPLLEGRPLPDSFSMKEIYGMFAVLDEHVHLPRLQHIVADDEPELPLEDVRLLLAREPWNEYEIGAVLDRVREARAGLVSFLQALPGAEWVRAGTIGGERRTIYDVAYGITQLDTDHLRDLAHRLHESHLTTRVQDLPK